MLKALSTINFLLGYATLTIAIILCGGNLLETDRLTETLILLIVGLSLTFAAGMGLKRMSSGFHAIAMTCFMFWAFYTLGHAETQAESNGRLSDILMSLFWVFKHGNVIYVSALVGLGAGALIVGTRLDYEGSFQIERDILDQVEAEAEAKVKAKVKAKEERSQRKKKKRKHTPVGNPSVVVSESKPKAQIDPRLQFSNNLSSYEDDETPLAPPPEERKIIRCTNCNRKIKVNPSHKKVRCPSCRHVMNL